MGREATCEVSYGGRTALRKVLLETDEIIVRGDPRVVIQRADITKADARGAVLTLAWKDGDIALSLGEKEAQKWAQEIMHPKSRLDKLGVKPGQRASLAGVTDAALAGELDAAGATLLGAGAKELDLLFLQIDEPAVLAKLEKAAARLASAGALWVLSPRGTPGLKDTDVMKAAKAAGLVDVKVVRFSETHSANKFVVPLAKRDSAAKTRKGAA